MMSRPFPVIADELTHWHTCPNPECRAERECRAMFCRGQRGRYCWDCRRRGFQEVPATVAAITAR